jgi:hypothetical protein
MGNGTVAVDDRGKTWIFRAHLLHPSCCIWCSCPPSSDQSLVEVRATYADVQLPMEF